jgi:hypothetical protein
MAHVDFSTATRSLWVAGLISEEKYRLVILKASLEGISRTSMISSLSSSGKANSPDLVTTTSWRFDIGILGR